MAFTDQEIEQYSGQAAAYCEQRIPQHVQDRLWMGFLIEGQSITLLTFRPHWKDKSKVTQTPVAKTTFVKKTAIWKIYWLRQDLKWHRYEPCPTVGTFEKFLDVVDEDKYGCFYG